MFYVFDLDGTLASVAHRRHLLPDYKAFNKACVNDAPIQDVVNLLLELLRGDNRIEIWSGREDDTREDTLFWLKEVCAIPVDEIVVRMRPSGDYRADEVLKGEWLADGIPDMIFDDRQKVVDMWRKNGVTCAQVAPGDFDMQIRPALGIITGEEPILVMMIGTAAAGKTSWLEKNFTEWRASGDEAFDPSCIISMDNIRANLCDDFRSQKRNRDVFKAMIALVSIRIRCGLRTMVDATNLTRAHREVLVELVPPDLEVLYLVRDRPLEEKLADAGWRDPQLIKDHDKLFRQQFSNIMNGDGFANVKVRIASYDEQGCPRTEPVAAAV